MAIRARRSLPAAGAMLVGVLVAACGGSSHTTSRRAAHPTESVALPGGVVSATNVEPNGYLWVLANAHGAATLTNLQLPQGGKSATVPVSASATSVAQSPTGGQLALGTGTASAGSVQLLDPAGHEHATIAVGAPVRDVVYGASGTRLYVLDANARSSSLTLISTRSQRAIATIGLPADTVAIVPNPQETAVWSVDRAGAVAETSLRSRAVIATVSTGSPGIAIATAPSGTTLYVLKGSASDANIAVVDTATSSMRRVLAAAAHSVDIGVSLNSNQLYDFVGTPNASNVQITGT